MVKKVTKYAAIDGKEFTSHAEAFEYEKGLQLIKDVQSLILDTVASTVDEQNRYVYNLEPSTALTLADMLVTTDLILRLKTVLSKSTS